MFGACLPRVAFSDSLARGWYNAVPTGLWFGLGRNQSRFQIGTLLDWCEGVGMRGGRSGECPIYGSEPGIDIKDAKDDRDKN